MAPPDRPSEGRFDLPAASGLFILALIPRLIHILEIRAAGLGDFLRLDPLYYHAWGARIAAGDWLGREAFEMSPLYPYLLGLVYALFGEGLLLPRILQALLGSLTCAGVFLLGRRLFGRAAGLAAGLALALYGPAIFYDGQINKTSLALALTLGFAGALALSRGEDRRWIAAGGAMLGLAALVHENVNLAAPVLLAWLLWPRRGEALRRRLAPAALFVAGYAAMVLPVTARNILVAGEPVLITSAGGENFYTGNHLGSSGRYSPPPFVRPDPFFEHEDFREEAARRLGRPVTRREASRYWWGEGLRFIRENPGAFAALLWDKFSVFTNAFERPDNFSYYNFKRFSRALALPWPGFGVLAPLALLGLALSARRWRELIPLYAAIGAYVLSALIFFTQSRYRMPAIPLLCVFAGLAVASLYGMARERRIRDLALSAALVAASFLFVTRDPGNGPAFHAQNDAILGELYLRAGRPGEAADALHRSLDHLEAMGAEGAVLSRIAGAARVTLGYAELDRGRSREAEAAFRAAVDCPDPDVRRDALEELTRLLEARGDRAGLAEALAAALEADPSQHGLRLQRARLLYGLGNYDGMIRELELVLSATPPAGTVQQADAWQGLALARAARGEREAAMEAAGRALALDPSRADAARLMERLGKGDAP